MVKKMPIKTIEIQVKNRVAVKSDFASEVKSRLLLGSDFLFAI